MGNQMVETPEKHSKHIRDGGVVDLIVETPHL